MDPTSTAASVVNNHPIPYCTAALVFTVVMILLLASLTPPTLKLRTVLNGHPDPFSTGPAGTVYPFATKLPPCYHHRIPVPSTKAVFVINSLPAPPPPPSTTNRVVNSLFVPSSIAAPDVNTLFVPSSIAASVVNDHPGHSNTAAAVVNSFICPCDTVAPLS